MLSTERIEARKYGAAIPSLAARFGVSRGIAFIDSTKIAVCHNKRISRNRVFKDVAAIGKTTVGWFYGFKVHLVIPTLTADPLSRADLSSNNQIT